MRLSGKTAIVTGAGGGIGRGIADAYAAQGAHVICADRDGSSCETTANTIRAGRGRASAVRCDVTDAADIARVIEHAERDHDGVDILVNAAGILLSQPLLETTRESLQRTLDVNLIGLFLMLQAAAKSMVQRKRGGRIVNIASIAGRSAYAGAMQYCASKAAVISLTQCAAAELASQGINVNAIAPGFIQTRMWDEGRLPVTEATGISAAEFDHARASTVPAGRLGTPDDIQGAAVFLASADSAYVVGQTLNVDGGVMFG